MSGAERRVEFEVPGGPNAGTEARRAIGAGDGWLPDDVRRDVLLLVTELVTNAVRHGQPGLGGSVRVLVAGSSKRVRVEVADAGPGFAAVPRQPGNDATGGWGLYLVQRIADRWGVLPAASGCCVWCELELQV